MIIFSSESNPDESSGNFSGDIHAIGDLLLKQSILYLLVLWLHAALETVESVQMQLIVRQHLTEGRSSPPSFLSFAYKIHRRYVLHVVGLIRCLGPAFRQK